MKIHISHRDDAKVLRLSSSNTEKILHCFLKKPQEQPFSPFPYGCLPQAKNLCQVFLLEQSSLNIPESCFSARLLNDPISWAASNHKISEALSSQKTGWSSSFLFCLPRSFHQSSHISRMSHTSGLYCSPSIQTAHKTGP